MRFKTQELFLPITAIFILILLATVAYIVPRALSDRDQAQIRALVEAFGRSEKNVVTVTGAPQTISNDVATNYAPYVTDALLLDWTTHPEQSPGRSSQGASPEGIEIDSLAPQGAGYIVIGRVIEVSGTSKKGTSSAEVPVVMQIITGIHGWRIAAYQEQST